MGKIIGIDLGTTTSEIAYLYEGKPKIIQNTEGDRIIPSVVGLNKDNILVFGNDAKRQLDLKPVRTVQEVKRLMGFNIKVKMGDKEYLPQEISALLLRYLKQCAEEYLGDKVTEAVITVPAMFNHLQRQATKDAAEIAGLKVERIINEPTAAALAYGLENLDKDEKVLVYDLGGGTFDVSILEMFGGILDVKVSRGNNALGGKDFDERLMNYIFNEFYRLHEIDLRKKGEHVLYRIKEAAEVAKIALSSNEYTDIILPYICQDRDENPIDISIRVTRQQFENMIWDMIQSTEHIVDEALKESGYKVDDIDVVLAIGGSTRIPCVQRLLNRKFGGKVRTDISPDEAVALGAAIQAGIKSGQYDSATEILITDTCSYSLGTSVVSYVGAGQLMDGIYDVLIPKNTTIPYTCRKTYTTVHDYQTSVNIEVYQGEEALVKNNLKIGVFTLSGIPEDLAGKQNIEISFTYDKNGILQVDATVVSTGVRATHKYILESMDSKQIETSKADLETLWRNSAFAEKSKAIIEIAGSKLEHLKPDDRKKVEDVITKLKQAIADENENLIEKYDTELTDLMFELE